MRRVAFEARAHARELLIQQNGGYKKARGFKQLSTSEMAAKIGVPI